MDRNILNDIKNRIYEAEGLLELMQMREDKIGELLPLLKARLSEALALAGETSAPTAPSSAESSCSAQVEEADAAPMYEIPSDDEEIDENLEIDESVKSTEKETTAEYEDVAVATEPRKSPVFCLNDRFRFRRTLFGGSDAEFNTVMDHVATLSGYEEAEDYFYGDLGLDPENEDVADFMEIMKTYFEK